MTTSTVLERKLVKKMTQVWLWIGCIYMTLGSVFFGFGADRAKGSRWQVVYTLNFFICAIAAALYLAMIFKQGYVEIDGRPAYLTRYITWTFSTPLTLILLSYLGRSGLLNAASMIGADVYMIVTGFVATISNKPISNVWYIVSCGAYLGLVYLLLKPYRQQSEQRYPRAKKVFSKLLTVHLIIWTAYPIVWILASTGFNVIDGTIESACYTILDVAAKVGFGFLALNSLKQLEQTEQAPQYSSERSFSRG
jgi:bacteriorhodopsin